MMNETTEDAVVQPDESVAADSHELAAVPRLGAVRVQALVEAGIETIAALRMVEEADLAQIKSIGPANARLIKEWISAQDAPGAGADEAQSGHPNSLPDEPLCSPSDGATGDPLPEGQMPSPSADTAGGDFALTTSEDLPETGSETGDYDPLTSDADVLLPPWPENLSKDVDRIDTAIHRLTETLPKKTREKKLSRQLDKVASSLKDVPESLAGLDERERAAAVKALARIEILLGDAVESGKLSAKKQEAMGAELRKHRKRLEKAIGAQPDGRHGS
ncbi:MAG: helix-hairpin-helix domain-containing protein [Capsulimonadaceae bacterium]